MEQFFAKAGDYIGHEVFNSGQHGKTVRFTYTNGTAEYDGKSWVFRINVA